MLKASYYAGCAFTKSYVGYVHAVAHSLGGAYNVPHGYANAVLLPYVLDSYGECIYKKLHHLAVAAGIARKDIPHYKGARLFIYAIQNMKKRYGIGNTIEEIREEDIPKLSHYADKEANPLYPVPVLMNAQELEKFYYMLMPKHHHPEEPEMDFQAYARQAAQRAAQHKAQKAAQSHAEEAKISHNRNAAAVSANEGTFSHGKAAPDASENAGSSSHEETAAAVSGSPADIPDNKTEEINESKED